MASFPDSLKNFSNALDHLTQATVQKPTTPLELAGTIKLFELAYETGWKALKSYLAEKQGIQTTTAKNVFQEAFRFQIISDQNVWLQMIQDRNISVHVYNQGDAEKLVERILDQHLGSLTDLYTGISKP